MEEIHQLHCHQINYNYQQNEDNTSCICDNSVDSDYFQSYYEKRKYYEQEDCIGESSDDEIDDLDLNFDIQSLFNNNENCERISSPMKMIEENTTTNETNQNENEYQQIQLFEQIETTRRNQSDKIVNVSFNNYQFNQPNQCIVANISNSPMTNEMLNKLDTTYTVNKPLVLNNSNYIPYDLRKSIHTMARNEEQSQHQSFPESHFNWNRKLSYEQLQDKYLEIWDEYNKMKTKVSELEYHINKMNGELYLKNQQYINIQNECKEWEKKWQNKGLVISDLFLSNNLSLFFEENENKSICKICQHLKLTTKRNEGIFTNAKPSRKLDHVKKHFNENDIEKNIISLLNVNDLIDNQLPTKTNAQMEWNAIEVNETVVRRISESNMSARLSHVIVNVLNDITNNNKELMKGIHLSLSTVTRKINKLGYDFHCQVVDEMKNAKYISFSFDETKRNKTDEWLIIYTRILNKYNVVYEFVYSLALVESTKATDIKNAFVSSLKYDSLNDIKVIAISSDGAASCIGESNGASTQIISELFNDALVYKVHCCAHRINLILKYIGHNNIFGEIIDQCKKLSKFLHQSDIKVLFKKFRNSFNGKKFKNIPEESNTRWTPTGEIVIYICQHINELKSFFNENKIVYNFGCIINNYVELTFLSDVFQILNKLIKKCQYEEASLPYLYIEIDYTISIFKRLENDFNLIDNFNEFTETSKLKNNFNQMNITNNMDLIKRVLVLFLFRFSSYTITDKFDANEMLSNEFRITDETSKQFRNKYNIESDIKMVLNIFGEMDIEEFEEKYRYEVSQIRSKYGNTCFYLYDMKFEDIQEYPNIYETVCKLIVTQATSVNCEKIFSNLKYFSENMPNAGENTIANRISLQKGVKMINIDKILFKWMPKSERKRRKFIFNVNK